MKKLTQKQKRKLRVRSKVFGTQDRPRMSVFKSNKQIYAQLIDDEKSITLLGKSTAEFEKDKMSKSEKAAKLGKLIAAEAKKKKISKIVFDKGASKYHGRVKSVADSAREAGLEF